MKLSDWKPASVDVNATVRQALEVLDKCALQIALVVDKDDFLKGTLTDGDIRRALLRGETLDSPVVGVMNTQPSVGLVSQNTIAWNSEMLARSIRHLPVVDDEGRIVGLFYEKKTIQTVENPVILMLGGLGTRLRPLTESVPKPMLNVGGKPILETIVRHIAEQGFVNFYFCINYLGEQIRAYFGDGSKFGINIRYVQEQERMGTAGALTLLPDKLKLPFIVMNGDLLTKIDLTALLAFHNKHGKKITAGVREYNQQVPFGVVELNGASVVKMVEKPVYRHFVNAGIYALSPDILSFLPQKQFYDMPSLIEDVLSENKGVGGFPITEYWMDIGQLPDFEQAQDDYIEHFQKN